MKKIEDQINTEVIAIIVTDQDFYDFENNLINNLNEAGFTDPSAMETCFKIAIKAFLKLKFPEDYDKYGPEIFRTQIGRSRWR